MASIAALQIAASAIPFAPNMLSVFSPNCALARTLAQDIQLLTLQVAERDAVIDGLPEEPFRAGDARLVPLRCRSLRRRRLRAAHCPDRFVACADLGLSLLQLARRGRARCGRRCQPINPVPHQHREQGVTGRPPASAPAASPSTKRAS
ncbi:MAG: hypothetical protein AAAB35_08210 [Phyllobacterium sp.]|uniref:hypothetical protein n=1 Tax=Phyllobacterium sp. TaxID=1871046 RepID=UPI0030F27006